MKSPGLSKKEIRRIVLDKLAVVYADWGIHGRPFEDFMTAAGERREDARAFVIALVAALVGGFAEAIEQNTILLDQTPHPRRRGHPRRELYGYRVEGEGGTPGNVRAA